MRRPFTSGYWPSGLGEGPDGRAAPCESSGSGSRVLTEDVSVLRMGSRKQCGGRKKTERRSWSGSHVAGGGGSPHFQANGTCASVGACLKLGKAGCPRAHQQGGFAGCAQQDFTPGLAGAILHEIMGGTLFGRPRCQEGLGQSVACPVHVLGSESGFRPTLCQCLGWARWLDAAIDTVRRQWRG